MTLMGRIISFPLIAGIPGDKWAHAWIGSTLAMSGLWLGWYGALPVIIYAVCKEVWDSAFPRAHASELWDAVATIAGGAIPLGLIMAHRMHP
jgi:hypothetical protein